MNPKEYKQMMDHLVAPKKKRTFGPLIPNLEKIIDQYDGPVIVDNGEIKFENQKEQNLQEAMLQLESQMQYHLKQILFKSLHLVAYQEKPCLTC